MYAMEEERSRCRKTKAQLRAAWLAQEEPEEEAAACLPSVWAATAELAAVRKAWPQELLWQWQAQKGGAAEPPFSGFRAGCRGGRWEGAISVGFCPRGTP